MKRLQKLTLNELKNEISTMEDREANCLKGGYTFAEMGRLMDQGCWHGGFVDNGICR